MRCLFVGWDGADWDILEPMVAAGHMPNLEALRSAGRHGVLRSTMPPHSVAAWTSFLTGVPPSRHGVVDFLRADPGRHFPELPLTSHDVPPPTVLDALGAQGLRVLSANIPMTFPPKPVNGWLVAGVFLPDGAPFVHPPEVAGHLDRLGGFPVNGMEWMRAAGLSSLLSEARALIRQRARVFRGLIEAEPWDEALVAFMAPDRVQHPAMHLLTADHPAWPGPGGPEREALLGIFAELDRALGDLIDAAGADLVVVASDHGFRPVWTDLVPNRLLEEMGYLVRRPVAARARRALRPLGTVVRGSTVARLARARLGPEAIVDWTRTQAYAPSAASLGVRLNVAGRDPDGAVPRAEADRLLDRIRTELGEARLPDGRKAFQRLVPAEEVGVDPGSGPGIPDLFYELGPGVGVSMDGEAPFTPSGAKTGEHRAEGIVVVAGDGALDLPEHIWDVPRLLARAAGTEFPAAARVPATPHPGSPPGVTDEEEDAIRRHLQDLGYVE